MSLASSATCWPGVLGHREPKDGGALAMGGLGSPWTGESLDTGSPRTGRAPGHRESLLSLPEKGLLWTLRSSTDETAQQWSGMGF